MLARLTKSALGAVFNTFSGIGTENDSGRSFQFSNRINLFPESEIISVYASSGVFAKCIDLIPNTACKFQLVNDEEELIPNHKEIMELLREESIIKQFCECSKSARLFKESYLILNLEDTGTSDEEITEGTEGVIKEIFAADTSQVSFETDNFQNRTMYYLHTEGDKIPIHPSRVLLFVGRETVPKIREVLNGYHCSLADGIMSSFGLVNHSLNLSSSLLSRMVTFVVKIAGLQDMVRAGEEELISRRLQLHRRGIGSIGGLVVDAESEDVSWLNLNLSGINELINVHRDYFTAETELTHDILWNEGSHDTASNLESDNWTERINEFLKIHWEKNLQRYLKIKLPEVGIAYTPFQLMYVKKTVEENQDIKVDKGTNTDTTQKTELKDRETIE